MDASRKIPGSIHDEKLIIQFYRRCPDNWVHINALRRFFMRSFPPFSLCPLGKGLIQKL